MFDEDLNEFFDVDGHGVEAVHVESGRVIKGIFDYEYIEVFDSGSRSPMFLTEETQNPISANDHLIIKGTKYRIVVPEPDGTGLLRLPLTGVA